MSRGIIIADTKFEFALDEATDEVVLVDEVLTPDSSRFWPASSYRVGQTPESFDKQFVRGKFIPISRSLLVMVTICFVVSMGVMREDRRVERGGRNDGGWAWGVEGGGGGGQVADGLIWKMANVGAVSRLVDENWTQGQRRRRDARAGGEEDEREVYRSL